METGKVILSENWWRHYKFSSILTDWFSHHLLGLFLSGKVLGKRQDYIYSGFLLEHEEQLWWFTAGHAVDNIKQVLESPNVSDLIIRWVDGVQIQEAESIPVDYRQLRMFSETIRGFDFGAIMLNYLDAWHIKSNGRSIPFSEQGWKNIHSANPQGFYLLGFPQVAFEVNQEKIDSRRFRNIWSAGVFCLPLRQVKYPVDKDRKSEFYNDSEAFYAEVVSFVDRPELSNVDVHGMSGGPILSVEQDPDGQFRYRLFGVQRSWNQEEKIIRAEPILRIAKKLENL